MTASNAAGSSEVSNPANGVTREAGNKLPLLLGLKVYVPLTAPSAPPSSVTVTGVTSSTISVQWGSVPCIHQNGDITGYSVQYEVMGSGNRETMSVPGAGTTQTTISGLTPSTTYSIQVAAVNNQLIGQYSIVESALTEGIMFCISFLSLHKLLLPFSVAAPVLTADSTTATSISILWTSGGSEGISYEVEWQRDITVGCSDDDKGSIIITNGSTSYTISGLEEDSRYTITVTAANTAGDSEMSNSVTAMTEEAGKRLSLPSFKVYS